MSDSSGRGNKLRWLWWIATRYLRSKRREKSRTAVFLSIGGIAVGTTALIVVLGVMNGFQFSTISNILELNSYHVRVYADASAEPFTIDAAEAVAREILELEHVRSAVPFAEVQTLVQGPMQSPTGVQIRGVPADLRRRDPGLADKLHMRSGSLNPEAGQAVIGMALARRVGARSGDRINLVHFEGSGVLRPQEADYEIAGIYSTEYYEFDSSYIFVDLQEAVHSLGATQIAVGVKLDDRFADAAVTRAITRRIDTPLEIQQWRDFDRSIFGALRLEKSLMSLLLGMVFVVVAVNIFQSLRRSVIERTEELGTLKALGAGPQAVQNIFVIEGAVIGILGAAAGGTVGLLLAQYLNEVLGFLRAVTGRTAVSSGLWSAIPVELVGSEVAAILCAAVLSTVVAGWAASRRVSAILPAEVLRDE